MDTQQVSDAERLDALLAAWHEERDERGRELSAAELCRECPALVPEVERRLRVVRRFEGLLETTGPEVQPDGNHAPTAADRAGPMPVIPGYEMLGKVGEGGMGLVYRARHLALNRVEAVKVVRTGEFAGSRQLARLRFEAEAAAGLDHPNIVTVYGVGEVRGQPYLAMRWVDGSSLADRRPGSPGAAAALVAKVARAVQYAHQRGILHRDLKPQNILIDEAGEPVVADFGIARRLDADATVSHGGGPVGTPAYMSPEQARGEPNLTVAADVYSLGGVLYELLTGAPPFAETTVYETLRKVQETEPTDPHVLNPAIPSALGAICLKCLEKAPADRYHSAAELAEDLERFSRGEPVTAQPPGFLDWLRQLWRTRPDPHPSYSWQVTAWFGGIVLANMVAITTLIAAGRSAAEVWLLFAGSAVGMWFVLWWYMARRFRRLPPTERHSMMIGGGHVVAFIALTAAYVPLSWEAPASDALGVFPGLAVVSGLALFTLGSTNWSRFFPIGLGVISLAPVLSRWPDASALVYGVVIAAVMWYWTYAKKVKFGAPRVRREQEE